MIYHLLLFHIYLLLKKLLEAAVRIQLTYQRLTGVSFSFKVHSRIFLRSYNFTPTTHYRKTKKPQTIFICSRLFVLYLLIEKST